jgi:hypothetical protein
VSYLARLAHANHLTAPQLRQYVAGNARGYPLLGWLSTASGQPKQMLRSRLRGLVGEDRDFNRQINQSRPMCRLCMARRGIHEPVGCWLPSHVTVCQRHTLWIGPPARTLDQQMDLRHHPQVLNAARIHSDLVHRYGTKRSQTALRESRHILKYWANTERSATASILDTTLVGCIGAYPDLVLVASLLATHSNNVQQSIIKEGIDWPTYLLMRINDGISQVHTDPRPLQHWVGDQRIIAARRTTPAARVANHCPKPHRARKDS